MKLTDWEAVRKIILVIILVSLVAISKLFCEILVTCNYLLAMLISLKLTVDNAETELCLPKYAFKRRKIIIIYF